MDDEEFREGLNSLDRLALTEYHDGLAVVSQDPDPRHAAVRLGRLVGVELKEPFAKSRPLASPSERTAAYRGWDLVASREDFDRADRVATWQYQALGAIKAELAADDPRVRDWTTYDFAFWAQNEEGFFGFFARAVRRYICGDPVVRAKVEEATTTSRKSGIAVADLSPEVVVASGGAALGTYLVATVPFLGFMGVPVIVALVLILYRLGVEGFCDWSNSLRTDEDEKH
ncbi:hypothetical protein IEZ26_13555 [Nocardioides cavernae]|uniref:DUF2207 domain-containing protein n=1 Tax=Nocardioides cavernae TaxID=1921566 RepID=A0ABR8NGT5_9ACTN|nr:hypothetical protein [Nocardioides cavernae]MBD3925654.1 hypothetical protein [Nocardioides cavernae]MBM7513237.1 hypothetical protein [Nocardioides cavernae]